MALSVERPLPAERGGSQQRWLAVAGWVVSGLAALRLVREMWLRRDEAIGTGPPSGHGHLQARRVVATLLLAAAVSWGALLGAHLCVGDWACGVADFGAAGAALLSSVAWFALVCRRVQVTPRAYAVHDSDLASGRAALQQPPLPPWPAWMPETEEGALAGQPPQQANSELSDPRRRP